MEDITQLLFLSGFAALFVSWLWVVVIAFNESLKLGLGSLLLNPFALYYAITRYKKCKIPLLIFSLGLIIISSFMILLNAFNKHIIKTYSPTEVIKNQIPNETDLKLRGVVQKGSIIKLEDGIRVQFILNDFKSSIVVEYNGILPDPFEEQKVVIAEGTIESDRFIADRLLVLIPEDNR